MRPMPSVRQPEGGGAMTDDRREKARKAANQAAWDALPHGDFSGSEDAGYGHPIRSRQVGEDGMTSDDDECVAETLIGTVWRTTGVSMGNIQRMFLTSMARIIPRCVTQ
jgi:hypothetical protein